MTDHEKAIVSAYTGVAMLVGDKMNIFYEYIAEICGRPIYTHELAHPLIQDEIKEKSKPDFIALCQDRDVINDCKSIKIEDEVFIHGFIDEIRTNTVIIRNDGGYFGTVKSEIRNSKEAKQ